MSFRHRLLKIKLIRSLSSVKIAVVCLFLLYVLTFVGTIAQTYSGLYLAQQRYFESFVFFIFNFIPFPGGQTVMWILFLNLVCVALTRFVYQWQRIGITIIHSGLVLFLLSAYVTLHQAQESHLTLKEGQASNVSTAYHEWEIAVWESDAPNQSLKTEHDVTVIDADRLKSEQEIKFEDLGFKMRVKEYYSNCEAYSQPGRVKEDNVQNASGITRLEAAMLNKEPEKNNPGGVFTVETSDNKSFDVLLYGLDRNPLSIQIGAKKYDLSLRLKHYLFPFTLKLKQFKKEEHPGTETPRSFQSLVEIEIDRAHREKLISMNDPLRYKDFTFYQAAFSVEKTGDQASTLAVVKNKGRLMPYISTLVTFLGLVTHFSMLAFRSHY